MNLTLFMLVGNYWTYFPEILRFTLSIYISYMKIFSCVRGAGRRGFTQQIRQFINSYQPNISFLWKLRLILIGLQKLLKRFNFLSPFFVDIPLIGFTGGI